MLPKVCQGLLLPQEPVAPAGSAPQQLKITPCSSIKTMPLFGLIPQGGCRHAGNLAVGRLGRKDARSHVEVPKHGPNPEGDGS